MAPPRIDPVKRILSRIEHRGTCWIYTGSSSGDGYGVIGIGRKSFRVHRIMFERFVRSLVDGELVCHKCDTPLCCNPDHLFAGSQKDNAIDRERKGRGNKLSGESHPNSKVSLAQKDEIISRRKGGETLISIAKDYGISFQHVSLICKRESRYGTGD
jgi:hypothetical protein